MPGDRIVSEHILKAVVVWAERRDDVRAITLVGSRARGTARPDSDVALVLLVADPEAFRGDRRWLDAIDWSTTGARPLTTHDAQYGAVWSCHVSTDQWFEVEFSFASLS